MWLLTPPAHIHPAHPPIGALASHSSRSLPSCPASFPPSLFSAPGSLLPNPAHCHASIHFNPLAPKRALNWSSDHHRKECEGDFNRIGPGKAAGPPRSVSST